ncbi:MAG TPA: hypothetical protein PLR30_12545 [Saprospiraceae bacterium]|nr:hypothetical protein [Saprospiraceae bacterium]
MKSKPKKAIKNKSLRQQILTSMQASFKIEGIIIPDDVALVALEKVEHILEKQIDL